MSANFELDIPFDEGEIDPDDPDDPDDLASHLRVRSFTHPGTSAAVVLWTGNQNAGQECEVTLTTAQVDKLIYFLKMAKADALVRQMEEGRGNA